MAASPSTVEVQTGRAPDLTHSNALKVVEKVGRWRELGWYLHVPESKLDEIQRRHTRVKQCKSDVLDYWLLRDTSPSWRRLIVALDSIGDPQARQAADSIRGYAEPVADSTLTLTNIATAVHTVPVGVWYSLARQLGVSETKRLELLYHPSMTNDQRMTAALQYWLTTVPGASWETLIDALYRGGWEAAALEAVRYIQKRRDPTFTEGNLYRALKDINDRWETLASKIGIRWSKKEEIKRKYHSPEQRLQAALAHWIDTHPAPSWQRIADSLYELGGGGFGGIGMRAHAVLSQIQELYITASEESRRLFEEAMKDGHVESATAKVVITGIAGSGKTSSKHVIFGEEPPELRRSTPRAERPIRVIRVDPLSSEWTRVGSERVKQFLAEIIKAHGFGVIQTPRSTYHITADSPEATTEDSSSSPVSPSSPPPPSQTNSPPLPPKAKRRKSEANSTETAFPNSSVSEEKGATNSLKSAHTTVYQGTGTSIRTASDSASHQPFAIEEELIKRIARSSGSDLLVKPKWVHFVDSGGQPQFHEVLPVFLRGTSVCLFVFKLSEELQEHPLVEYYDEEGKLIGKPYRADHTNEQILRHCVRTMYSHRSQSKGKAPRVLIIGTHQDKEGECKETREEKNQKLREMLLPNFEDEVIYYGGGFLELIFPINARHPGIKERQIAEEIRRVIMSECSREKRIIPIRWYALELLLKELAESLGRQVLSTEECLKAARRLQFDEKSFEAALEYLDDLNLIFYYKKVLPGIIFCDTQVLLDKVSEPVKYSHQLKDAPAQEVAIRGEVKRFCDYGLVTAEFLNQFPSHYMSGLFSPQELIKLFQDLLIFADFSRSEFFMPCLLRIIRSAEVDKHRVSPTAAAAPLVLYFPHGPLLGEFCSLVSYLLSPENGFPCPWELVKKQTTPICLHRNCVKFKIPRYAGTISLIDSFQYFEVHLDVPARLSSRICPQLCPIISDAVFAGLRKASITLHYDDPKPEKAFICPCGQGDHHPAIVGADQSFWVCSDNSQECDYLQPNQLMWLPTTIKEEARALVDPPAASRDTPASGSCAATLRLQEADLAVLLDLLKDPAARWREIGLNLGFTDGELDSIECTPVLIIQGPSGYLRRLLSQWLKKAPPTHSWPTVEALASALRRAGEEAVAFNLRDRFEAARSGRLLL